MIRQRTHARTHTGARTDHQDHRFALAWVLIGLIAVAAIVRNIVVSCKDVRDLKINPGGSAPPSWVASAQQQRAPPSAKLPDLEAPPAVVVNQPLQRLVYTNVPTA